MEPGQLIFDEKQVTSLPTNNKNSCFIDSSLVALFYTRCPLVEFLLTQHVLQPSKRFVFGDDIASDLKFRRSIQKLLKLFIGTMHSATSTTSTTEVVQSIRAKIHECRFASHFNDSNQHDAFDFLSDLFEILQLDRNVNTLNTQVYATNDILAKNPCPLVLTTSRQESTGCVCHVRNWCSNTPTSGLLANSEDSRLLDTPLRSADGDNFYHRTITLSEFIPSIFFVLHFERTALQTMREPVCIDPVVNNNGRMFVLHAVILHEGSNDAGHYTTLVKKMDNNTWCLYNGALTHDALLVELGHFQLAIEKSHAATNAVCAIYTSPLTKEERKKKPLNPYKKNLRKFIFKKKKFTQMPKTIVFFGDSLVEGYGVTELERFSTVFKRHVQDENLPWEVINCGKSGDTICSSMKRFETCCIAKSKPQIAVIVIGGNDLLTGRWSEVPVVKKELINLVVAMQQDGTNVVLVGLLPPFPKELAEQASQIPELQQKLSFCLMYESVATETKCSFIPSIFGGLPLAKPATIVENMISGLFSLPANFEPGYFLDEVHFNSQAHKIVGRMLFDNLRNHLKLL